MKLIQEAYEELFPEKEYTFDAKIRYSKAFKDYNANIKYNRHNNQLTLSLSKKWNEVSKDIKKGLIQELLVKMFSKKDKTRTLSMDLYQIFLKNTHLSVEKNKIEPYLNESFSRVNEKYFSGMLDQTNLVWGNYSKRTLGRYEYGSDTIMISKIFENSPIELLDMVMYHEMLHKKHKFHVKNGRSMHHTTEFRNAEKRYDNFEEIEKQMQKYVRYYRIPKDKIEKKKTILDFFKF